MELTRTLGQESRDVAIGLSDLADAEKASGDLDAAERDYREALRISCAVDFHEGVAGITGNLGGLALRREDWSGAELLVREALSLYEKIGRPDMIGNCRRLAEALLKQRKKAEAVSYAQRAVETYTRLDSPVLVTARETLAECES